MGRLPAAERPQLLAAIATFDAIEREAYNFRQNDFVLVHDGRMYPPKRVISLATGMSTKDFSGGEESNRYLRARGFTILNLRDPRNQAVREMLTAKSEQKREVA